MIRLRVYPQYNRIGGFNSGGFGGFNRGIYGGMNSSAWNVPRRRRSGLAQQIRHERQTSAMRLRYERQMWRQQTAMARVQARYQYGMNAAPLGAWGGVRNVALPPVMYPGYNPCVTRTAYNTALGVSAIRNVFGSSNSFWGNVASMF